MAKLIPREGGVIRHDPAAASRKRPLQPRAALQPTRGSAAGRAQPGAGVAKTCLSVAGVLRRNLLCRAHLQKKITGSHNPAETNQRGAGDRETKGAAASRRGRAGVNPERYGGGERSTPPAGAGATLKHPGQNPRDAAPAPWSQGRARSSLVLAQDRSFLPAGEWRRDQPGDASSTGPCLSLLHLHYRLPARTGQGGCEVPADGSPPVAARPSAASRGPGARRPPRAGRGAGGPAGAGPGRAARSCPWC